MDSFSLVWEWFELRFGTRTFGRHLDLSALSARHSMLFGYGKRFPKVIGLKTISERLVVQCGKSWSLKTCTGCRWRIWIENCCPSFKSLCDSTKVSDLSHSLVAIVNLYSHSSADNYPEAAKRIINVNAPFIFRLAWSLVKHFFDHNVAAKMMFVGPNDTESVLKEYVDLKVLPKEIVAAGQGKAAPGLPQSFVGGPLPPPGEERNDASHFKKLQEAVSDSESADKSLLPKKLSIQTNDDQQSVDEERSIFSNAQNSAARRSPIRSYCQEKKHMKDKRKEEEIKGVREMAAIRLQPKERSVSQQGRLGRLRDAMARRQLGKTEDIVDGGSSEKTTLFDRATNHLLCHDRRTRFIVMSSLFLLFFLLLHPRLVLTVLGIDQVQELTFEAWWLSALQGLGLLIYTLIWGIVHFFTIDIAMVYAYNALNVGAKSGTKMKEYYSDNVRMVVAAVSSGIYVLSVGKAATRLVLWFAMDHAKVLLPLLTSAWRIDSEATCTAEESGFDSSLRGITDYQCCVPTDETAYYAECAYSLATFISSWVGFGKEVHTSWKLDLFGTAKFLYSYTVVFLLVLLLLFNCSASWALRESIPDKFTNSTDTKRGKPSPEEVYDLPSIPRVHKSQQDRRKGVRNLTEDGTNSNSNHDSVSELRTQSMRTLSDGGSSVSGFSSTSRNTKRRRLRFLSRSRLEDVSENDESGTERP